MLVTQQPVLKRFWYPVLPLDRLADSPIPFQLLGQKLVVWRNSEGKPVAVEDRCCHRSAQLSLGKVNQGRIACPYHGWEFDGNGACKLVPQLPDKPISPRNCIQAFSVAERYGYVWVCLDEPLADIPDIVEADDNTYRLIPEFYETWQVAGLRVMENEFDTAHPTYVHTSTFGSEGHRIPDKLELTKSDRGLHMHTVLGVANNDLQQQNLKLASEETVRTMDMTWFLPFTCKIRIAYPNGMVHVIVNTATPIDDRHSQIVQFCLRNDTEAETAAADVVAFDRAVTLEDKRILETTDPDVPLDPQQELHMFTDKPGLMMRRRLAQLLQAYGEVEQTARQ